MTATTPEPDTAVGQVFVDALTFGAALQLLRTRPRTEVAVLDAVRGAQRIWVRLLRFCGIEVSEARFFAGHMYDDQGQSIYLAAHAQSAAIALDVAKTMVASVPELRRLNAQYGRNTIRLIVAKAVVPHIRRAMVRILAARALGASGRSEIWLPRPDWFDASVLVTAIPGVDTRFYSPMRLPPIETLAPGLVATIRDLKLRRAPGAPHAEPTPAQRSRPAVLMLQEDRIRVDPRLRGQPHWVDPARPPADYEMYILALGPQAASPEDTRNIEHYRITVLSRACLRRALAAARGHQAIRRRRLDRRRALRAARRATPSAERLALIRVAAVLRQAELMGSLALWVNAKTFLIRETYYTFADAMQLVAPDLDVRTIAYQYANLGAVAPGLLSTADTLVTFSDMYRAVYDADGIAPDEIVTAGYLYDGTAPVLRERSRRHREALEKAGAAFIICYLDESVQLDRWGLVSKEDHLGELHALAQLVLADPTVGVVVKSQFIFNSPSQLYPDDSLIQRAKASGRYVELREGMHRNDIFPTEAALVADLCIGHKFGATAALEAALAGVRTLLLDRYGTRTRWDAHYREVDIEYPDMETLLAKLGAYRLGAADTRALGDWTPIIHHFDPYRDGRAMERLRALVEDSVLAPRNVPAPVHAASPTTTP